MRKWPTDEITMKNVYLPEMDVDLIPHYVTEGRSIFPRYGVEAWKRITGPLKFECSDTVPSSRWGNHYTV